VDLRLDDPDGTAEGLGSLHRFVDGERGDAARGVAIPNLWKISFP
jgi:hypothetical protein